MPELQNVSTATKPTTGDNNEPKGKLASVKTNGRKPRVMNRS